MAAERRCACGAPALPGRRECAICALIRRALRSLRPPPRLVVVPPPASRKGKRE
jgi:hypothetical protein